MSSRTERAIVAGAEPVGESDRRVALITPGLGRVHAVAKGALRSKKRFIGVFDLAQYIEVGLMTAPRTGRIMIEHASVIEPFPLFRQSPARLGRAAVLVETAMLGTAEQHPAQRAFDTLLSGLRRLHAEPDSDRWAIAYAFRLLDLMGYKPCLEGCACCGRGSDPAGALFDASAGGIVCGECSEAESAPAPPLPPSIQVSMDVIKTLCAIMEADEQTVGRISFTRSALTQARAILSPFIAFHLPRPSRALEFMDKIA